jgi:hypothetical protein
MINQEKTQKHLFELFEKLTHTLIDIDSYIRKHGTNKYGLYCVKITENNIETDFQNQNDSAHSVIQNELWKNTIHSEIKPLLNLISYYFEKTVPHYFDTQRGKFCIEINYANKHFKHLNFEFEGKYIFIGANHLTRVSPIESIISQVKRLQKFLWTFFKMNSNIEDHNPTQKWILLTELGKEKYEVLANTKDNALLKFMAIRQELIDEGKNGSPMSVIEDDSSNVKTVLEIASKKMNTLKLTD